MVRNWERVVLAGFLTSVVVTSFAGCSGTVISGKGVGASNEGPDGAFKDAGAASAGGRLGSGGATAATGGRATAGGSTGVVDASSNETGGASDAGHAPPPPPEQDAGPTPPPYCVAPCVWEVVKHCIPELRSCMHGGYSIGAGTVTATCDPVTGWSEHWSTLDGFEISFAVSYGGIECFSWTDGFPVVGTFGTSTLTDRFGNVVAARRPGSPIYCGAASVQQMQLSSITDAVAELGDGGFVPAYHVDRSRPECAAWDDYGLPVLPHCEVMDGAGCP